MLTELHIENLGVIESADLVLGAGLTAITGETGAGKTMLVEALDLVVGGRAEAIVVRHGAAAARVDARFLAGERELVLTRVVPANGRSRAYVDGRPATVTALADAAAELLDLHGQHAHQRLLSVTSQREALDAFGAVDLGPLHAARARLTEIDAELATLGGDERARARELDLARFQLAELDAAGVTDAGEDEALDALEDVLGDALEHKAAGAGAHQALTADGGGRDALAAAAAALAGRVPYRDLAERLAGLLAELDDVAAEVRDAAEGIDEDPARLAEVRARRQQLRDLCRKYGDTLADVMSYHREVAARVGELEAFDARASALDADRREALAAVAAAAAGVRLARERAAPELATAISMRLAELAMPNASVVCRVGDDATHDPAGDDVELLLAANPGTPPLPLAKVASGGELARTMLALRLVMIGSRQDGGNHADAESTLVFDEVDAGIGGTAATAVARALAEVAKGDQVLVVTHLPQVAAAAATQISVTKHVHGERTTASAKLLGGAERVGEIARMLSGDEGGKAAERHARELLSR